MKYFIGVLAVILLLIFSVVLIVNDSNDSLSQNEQATTRFSLSDEVDTPSARLVFETRGEINGQDEHESVRVTVNRTQRKLEVLKGYERTVSKTEVFKNNDQAYETFLLALDKAKFNAVQTADYEDKTGACPFGNVRTYQFVVGQDTRLDTWSTTCREDGTFAGEENLVKRLFEAQIPEYRSLVRNVNL